MATTTTSKMDTDFLVKKSMTAGYQYLSLLTPPAYLTYVMAFKGRSTLSVNRLLRATWLGGAIGTAGGGTLEYLRSAYSSEENLRKRRIAIVYDPAVIRAEDHSTIGGLLFAMITPAFLWKRARAVHLILGGAGIGSSVGLLAHWTRSLTGDPPPRTVIPRSVAAAPSSS